jgi:hypothetical protein
MGQVSTMWLRVDDKFPDHPKVRGLDATALAVWLCAACWSAEYEQDGKVTLEAARQLAARFDPQESLLAGEPPVVSRLVTVGLWERTDIGYVMHDFLEYNPSKSDLAKRRKRERSRRRKGYRDKVSARRRVARNVSPTTPHVASTRTRPVPVVVPVLQVLENIKTPTEIAELVDKYRALPGVTAASNDGGVIAGQVGLRVVTDQIRPVAPAVVESGLDLGGPMHDMAVGEDEPVRREDEAGPAPARLARAMPIGRPAASSIAARRVTSSCCRRAASS